MEPWMKPRSWSPSRTNTQQKSRRVSSKVFWEKVQAKFAALAKVKTTRQHLVQWQAMLQPKMALFELKYFKSRQGFRYDWACDVDAASLLVNHSKGWTVLKPLIGLQQGFTVEEKVAVCTEQPRTQPLTGSGRLFLRSDDEELGQCIDKSGVIAAIPITAAEINSIVLRRPRIEESGGDGAQARPGDYNTA
ncbi:hypothetical protein PHYPSEUDO_013592 [Phytophthora pseudosyringae]|uniref:Uncharacterized protein n=1 Tax=Phytophthora pseudosyringae TaxID=221518 RepID=A0A8T1V5V2_9STRA|nr:hypothetical protein PHYPSEUDO_013592 [Phytophthora pseudosyringae]